MKAQNELVSLHALPLLVDDIVSRMARWKLVRRSLRSALLNDKTTICTGTLFTTEKVRHECQH